MKYRRIVATKKGGPDVLKLVEETLPEPQAGEVRIKVHATGVAFADIFMREGYYPGVSHPVTPGYDIVGEVDKPGAGVTSVKPGESVIALTVTGGYAEFLCVPEARLVSFQQSLDPGEAVSIVLNYLTAWQMLHRMAHVEEGESILVHGAAGGVGTALLQLGKLFGLEMYGTASSTKHAVVSDLGATAIDYRASDFVKVVKGHTRYGVDAVFDPIGGAHLGRSFKSLKSGGRMISYGFSAAMSKGRPNLPKIVSEFLRMPRFSPMKLMNGNKTVAGYMIQSLAEKRRDWYQKDLNSLVDLLTEGKIKPIVAERIPLEEASRAHQLLNESAVVGKIVLLCNQGE